MSRVAALHASLIFTCLLLFGVLALWGGVSYLRNSAVSATFRAGLMVGELLVLAEAVLGALLLATGARPYRPEIHYIYALVAVLTLPTTLLLNRNREERRALLVYVAACGFLCLIMLRALETGRAPGT